MSVTAYGNSSLSTSSTMLNAASNTSSTSSTTSTKKTSNASLSADDFLKLFVKQLQNQDSTNPMDSSEMMSQITQLSNMQMMQNMANYSKSNYAVSLVGKYVKATAEEDGEAKTITGTIDRVTSKNGTYTFYIGDKSFSSDDITEVSTAPEKTTATTTTTTTSTTTDTTTK